MDAYFILDYLRINGGPVVLATIIDVEGHAYRKEGAIMLFLENGRTIGSISPGCLESDLAERVPVIVESGIPEVVVYNVRPEEDPIWGEAIGCGGVIRVLLESVQGRLLILLREAWRLMGSGNEAYLSREWSGNRIRYRLNAVVPSVEPSCIGQDSKCGIYTSVFVPRSRLLIFGAGQDAMSLHPTAQRIGFQVVIADWRSGLLSTERFPGAELVDGGPEEVVRKLDLGLGDYIVICSHQIRSDKEMLRSVLSLQLAYIGVMGSRKRIAYLFEGLPITSNVHGPIGLDIYAEGSEEIAISIAAELIAVRARRKSANS